MATDSERPDFDTIRDAFDRMTPSPEAEKRMLGSLLETARVSPPASPKQAACAPEADSPKGKHAGTAFSPRAPLWRRIRIAACLVLAMAGGVFGYKAMTIHNEALSTSAQTASFTAASPDNPVEEDEGLSSGGSGGSVESAESSTSPEDSSGSALRDCSATALSHPFVRLSSGTQLRIALGEDGLPLLADESALAADPEAAWASDETGKSTLSCYVRTLPDGDYPYAVSYAEDSEFYLAEPVS